MRGVHSPGFQAVQVVQAVALPPKMREAEAPFTA